MRTNSVFRKLEKIRQDKFQLIRARQRQIPYIDAPFARIRTERAGKRVSGLLNLGKTEQRYKIGIGCPCMTQSAENRCIYVCFKYLPIFRGQVFGLPPVVCRQDITQLRCDRTVSVCVESDIKLTECQNRDQRRQNIGKTFQGCRQLVNQAVVADPLAKVSVQPRELLTVGKPQITQNGQSLLRLDLFGQIENFVNIQENVAVVGRQIDTVTHIVAPIEIPAQLIL